MTMFVCVNCMAMTGLNTDFYDAPEKCNICGGRVIVDYPDRKKYNATTNGSDKGSKKG